MTDERRRPRWQRPTIRFALIAVVAVSLLVGFVWLWWLGVPALYRTAGGGEDARLSAVTTTRAALLAGFVGLGAVGTFWLNSQIYQITARTFELTRQGQLTDRYTTAIEQLGNDKLDVRLGGIYALEQLAADSRGTRDHATIVEVLSAFVRVHAGPSSERALVPASPSSDTTDEGAGSGTAEAGSVQRPPGVDVQAALTVLGRLPVHPRARVDLRATNLRLADLREANLVGARLQRSDLTEAFLRGANLTGANLSNTILDRAYLYGADLSDVYDLDDDTLAASIGDRGTVLSTGRRRPATWPTDDRRAPG